MSTPTATPRTTAALEWVRPAGNDSGPPNEQYVCADVARTLETELAAAKAECERLMNQRDNLLKPLRARAEDRADAADEKVERLTSENEKLTIERDALANGSAIEIARLRAELAVAKNWVEHHSKHADDLIAENVKLRADLERFTGHGLLDCHAICDQRDAAVARAERAEAALAEWSVLNLWGGTPEIIHEFIKGQQNRIHHCQDLEAECLEQARLLGMSGEREADLLGKIERLAKDNARLDWLEEKMWFVRANVMLHDEVPPYTVKTCDGIVHGATVRAAIDAAMKP